MTISSIASRVLGPTIAWRYSIMARTLRGLRYDAEPIARTCNICNFRGYFRAFGWPVRIDAQCPQCESLERHRLFALWLSDNHGVIAGSKVLHFAPEPSIKALIAPLANEYVTADLAPGRADVSLNIEQMTNIADQSLDIIICFHVLEHVNDQSALREIRRALKPSGAALLMVPLVEGLSSTYEDASIIDPAQRFIHYGQDDHVRIYGADFRSRVAGAGFALSEYAATELFVLKYGLERGEKLFVATPR